MSAKLKKALKILLRSGSLASVGDLEVVEVLQEEGMIFPVVELPHDQLIDDVFEEFLVSDRDKVVSSFLYGLEFSEPQKRAALSAYAILLEFPRHSFTSTHGVQCDICSGFHRKKIDLSLVNAMRYSAGSTNSGAPEQLWFFLQQENKAAAVDSPPTHMLKQVLAVLREATPADTPLSMEKKIRKIAGAKYSQEESRGLLDLFGQIGVLESPDHKGFMSKYVNIGLAPKKSRSTDWSYPVDFWLGEYGVNEVAVDFWFGKYLG
jgi:hypothetical protein